MLTVLLPVTRPWALQPVTEAIAASDIPREDLILYLDAPGCETWETALSALGFAVETRKPDKWAAIPDDRLMRRRRHLAMRRATQTLVPDGLLLCLEDDSMVPPDVWARLYAASEHGAYTVTGVQRSRYGRELGVLDTECIRPEWPGRGIEPLHSCGLYCLLTTGAEYRRPFVVRSSDPIDMAQTRSMSPRVDWGCKVGHLTRTGEVLMPDYPVNDEGKASLTERLIPEDEQGVTDTGHDFILVPTHGDQMFRALGRVVRGGSLMAAEKQLVPLVRAVEWGIANPDGSPRLDAEYYPPRKPTVFEHESLDVEKIEAEAHQAEPTINDDETDSRLIVDSDPQEEVEGDLQPRASREDLLALCKERGVKCDGRWGESKLEAALAEAEE